MMNIRFGNKKLKARTVVQIYGLAGCGKTILASRIAQDFKGSSDLKVITLDARAVDLDVPEFLSRLKELYKETQTLRKDFIFIVDGMDCYEEGKSRGDECSILIYDILSVAMQHTYCKGIILVSQHIVSEFNTDEDIVIQVGRFKKGNNISYMAILQKPVTAYPIIDMTIDMQNEISSMYNFLGYSETGITYS